MRAFFLASLALAVLSISPASAQVKSPYPAAASRSPIAYNSIDATAQSGADMCAKISAAATALHAVNAAGGTIDARGFTGSQSCAGSMFASWPAAPFYADVWIGSVTISPPQVSPINGRIITAPLSRYVYDVRAYGAKGDGVTDDTAAIQAAEISSEAPLPGGEVDFPCGDYLTSTGPIVINDGYIGTGSGSAPNWRSLCGPRTHGEASPYVGAAIENGNPTRTASVTVTSATPAVVTWTAHGFALNYPVYFNAVTAPTGMVAGTVANGDTLSQIYFVYAPTTNTFELCTSYTAPGATCASLVNTSSTGTTVVGNTYGDAVFETAGNGNLTQQGNVISGLGFVGYTANSPVTFTNSSSTIGWTANGLTVGQAVHFGTTGALPTNFTVGTVYYVLTQATNSITVATTYNVNATAVSAGSAGSGTQTGYYRSGNNLHLLNVMHTKITDGAFRDAANGIFLEGPQDDSGIIISGNDTRNNAVFINQGACSTGCGNNEVSNNHVALSYGGDMGMLEGQGAAQLRVIGNHFDGAIDGNYKCAIEIQGNSTSIVANTFENPTAVCIPQSVIGNNLYYRGTKIEGNSISGDSSSAASITGITCTTSTVSLTMTSCSPNPITAGVVPGMIVISANVPAMAFGSGGGSSSPSGNILDGGVYVTAVTSNSVTITNDPTASGSAIAMTFELPTFSWPLGLTNYFAPVVVGNSYITWHGPPSLGNDGF